MKPSELKNFQVVTTRNGKTFVVHDDFLYGEEDILSLDMYIDGLKNECNRALDIISVYYVSMISLLECAVSANNVNNANNKKLIWKEDDEYWSMVKSGTTAKVRNDKCGVWKTGTFLEYRPDKERKFRVYIAGEECVDWLECKLDDEIGGIL